MDTGKFKSIAKKGMMTVAEVAVVTGGALLTTKFLDFNTLFKDQIAKDPTFADKWFVKYQAPIKLVAGATLAAYVKNPWLKLAFFGIAVNGAIGSVRLLTAKSDGTNFFQPVGNSMEQRLQQYAHGNMGSPYSNSFMTNVGKPVDLMNPDYTNVAGPYSQGFKTNVGNATFLRGVPTFQRGINGTGCASTM